MIVGAQPLQKQIDDVRERQRNEWIMPLTLLALSTAIQLWMQGRNK